MTREDLHAIQAHMLSDVGGFIVSLVALQLSRMEATKEYTFGYKQAAVCSLNLSAVSAHPSHPGRSSGRAVVSGPCLGPYSSSAVGGLRHECLCRAFRTKQAFRIVAEGSAKIFQETQLKLLGRNSYTVFCVLPPGRNQSTGN